MSAEAFEARKQRGFFAADVCAGSGVRINFVRKFTAQNVFADKTGGTGFGKSLVHNADQVIVFAAEIYIACGRAERVRGDQHSFDKRVRVAFEQIAVLERARFGFVGVADKVFRLCGFFWNERPFHSGREAGTAASAKRRSFYRRSEEHTSEL